MLLRHVGYAAEAEKLADAMKICTADGAKVQVTGHRDGATCAEFSDYLFDTFK